MFTPAKVSPEWTVSGYWFQGLLETAVCLGLDPDRVFTETRLPPAILCNLDEHRPVAEMFLLVDVIRSRSNDSDIGIHYCIHAHTCSFGVLGMAAYTANHVREAWGILYRFSHLAMNAGRAEFFDEGATVSICWYPYSRSLVEGRFFVDAVVSGWVHRSSQLAGRRIRPLAVSLTYPQTRMSRVFVDTYTENVAFGQPYNCMTFRKEDMDRPVLYGNRDLNSSLMEHANRALLRLRSRHSLSERLKNHLKGHLDGGEVSIQDVAGQLHMSERSLQRKLMHENTSFNEILNSVRHELALRYLSDPHLSAQDIALLLGYQQSSSFSTAFKGWTGSSPTAYRERIRSQYPST